MSKVFIKSFGCQMNKLDSALVASALENAGFCLTDSVKEADVVLINTCSVREHAEQRVFSHIGHLKHIREKKAELVVGIIGCMAQRLGRKLLETGSVDIVCGPAQIPQIAEIVKEALERKEKVVSITEKIRQPIQEKESQALDDFECRYDSDNHQIPGQAFVTVMRGCNNFCSYCIVPYVRGPEVSRPPKAIIEQVKNLADKGLKQVTLLGQTVNSYKYIQGEKTYCLADIFEMISDINGIKWIRFVTNYPQEEFFDPILKAMADLPKVCNYLHMPAQSGSDKILKAMNRKYTAGQYLDMLSRAREIVPDISIAGDFIVGFPGETDEDFSATVDLVKRARYKNAFIFKYSPRPATIADKRLEDNIPPDVKKKRNIELLSVQEKNSDELSREFLDKEVTVLVEGPSKKSHINLPDTQDSLQLVGRTAADWIVVFEGSKNLTGKFAKVKITNTSPLTLFGRIDK